MSAPERSPLRLSRRLPLSPRLALRAVGAGPLATVVSAIALAVPVAALFLVYAVAASVDPNATDSASTTFTVLVGAAPLGFGPAAIAATLVAASLLVRSRDNERTLALLEAVGAGHRVRLRVASASGVILGLLAAAVSLVLGVAASAGYLALFLPAAHLDVSPVAVTIAAVCAFLLGWLTSLVPLLQPSSRPLLAELRALPRPLGPRWNRSKLGRIFVVIGFALLLVAIAGIVAGSTLDVAGWLVFLLSATTMLITPALLLLLAGAILQAPAAFESFERLLRRSTAARLAARDAGQSRTRSLPTIAAIMIICFVIGAYSSVFRASAIDQVVNYQWTLQLNQAQVELIDPGWNETNAPLDPHVIDGVDPVAVRDSLAADLEVPARVLSAVNGPYYGSPVDEFEGYSGRQLMVFPSGGLPTPVIADDGPCATASDRFPQWQCESPGVNFELDPLRRAIWVGDLADLALMLGHEPDASTKGTFLSGGAIVFDARYLAADDTTTIAWYGPDQFVPENEPGEFLPTGTPLKEVTLPASVVPLEHALTYGMFLSTDAAAAAGLVADPTIVLAQFDSPPTAEQEAAASFDSALGSEAFGQSVPIPWIERGPTSPDYAWVIGGLAIGILATLAIAIAAVGLARVDGRSSARTLLALGARPGIASRVSGWYALFVIGYGSVIGAGAAALLTLSFWPAGTGVGPLPEFALLGLAVPLLAALVARLWPRPRA